MHVRRIRLLSDSAVRDAQDRIAAAVRNWELAWLGGEGNVQVACRRCWEAGSAPKPLQRFLDGEDEWMAFGWEPGFMRAFEQALFPAEQRYESGTKGRAVLSTATAAAAMDAFLKEISSSCGGAKLALIDAASSADKYQAASAFGSGAILSTITVGQAVLNFVLDMSDIQTQELRAGTKSSLAAFDSRAAFGTTPVRLEVAVGEAEVDIGGLMALQLGDVIRLDCPLDHPLPVLAPGGTHLFSAYLGKLGKNIAIEAVIRNPL